MAEEKILVEEVVEATEEVTEEKSLEEMSIEELEEKASQIWRKTDPLYEEEDRLLHEKSQIQEKIDSCKKQREQIYEEEKKVREIISAKTKEEKLEKFKRGTYWTAYFAPTVGETKLYKVLSSRKYHGEDRICKLLIIDLFEQTVEVREFSSQPNVFVFNWYGLLDLREAPKEFVEGTLEKAKKLFKM